MLLAAPTYHRRTLADRVMDHLADALVRTGEHLHDALATHVARRAAGALARRERDHRRYLAAEQVRDNAAQINPLGLR
ncbi:MULTISPECIES: hypothetical protein [Isoptericola]|uniref:Uncharacterized protein n=1 Tax=Isoptericola haloaureus TaxID=1542902 RepID=A0ABU7Z552_9MICO|nr:hypothetical protein [Isoptericola sp. AK164]